MSRYGWKPYVPVAARKAKALKKTEKLLKKGMDIKPVNIEGRTIARTFWGKGWCNHIETFSDYENRLPRGRSYVRNGSVCHLDIAEGQINALVSGSQLYTVTITVKPLAKKKWDALKTRCAGQIGSLVELLEGRLSKNVMTVVTDPQKGLFPLAGEIGFQCSCPDWAVMCKHVASVLYGVGARLDEEPELIFLLRGVDRDELITAEADLVAADGRGNGRRRLADDSLSDVFGIDLGDAAEPKPEGAPAESAAARNTGRTEITGAAVTKLRKKFGMTKTDFARLMGVSPATVGNWERKNGTIALQVRAAGAWAKAKKMTKAQARKTAGL
jgi:uncharacterized Zn finger protein/DNA-binding XRE family transcriptional regulator